MRRSIACRVAAVYDGRGFQNYVNRGQQGAAEVRLAPQHAGRSSIGVRMNLVNNFKGEIRLARSRAARCPRPSFSRYQA
jgi:hypothetical protein